MAKPFLPKHAKKLLVAIRDASPLVDFQSLKKGDEITSLGSGVCFRVRKLTEQGAEVLHIDPRGNVLGKTSRTLTREMIEEAFIFLTTELVEANQRYLDARELVQNLRNSEEAKEKRKQRKSRKWDYQIAGATRWVSLQKGWLSIHYREIGNIVSEAPNLKKMLYYRSRFATPVSMNYVFKWIGKDWA